LGECGRRWPMATRRAFGGQGRDAEQGEAPLVSARRMVRVRSREGERGIVPLADEWDPLTIERKRKKKGGASWACLAIGPREQSCSGERDRGLC
jgi:hypothetical protein